MGGHLLRRARRTPSARSRLGLIDLGLQQGDKVVDPQPHAPRVDLRELRRSSPPAAPSVSIYQTNSPEECHYVLEHSESRAVFVEDAEQLAKVREVAGPTCPHLEFDHRDRSRRRRHRRRDHARRRCASAAAAATRADLDERVARRRRRRRLAFTSTPPAPPARPRAASSPTATTAEVTTMTEAAGGRSSEGDDRLPVPPARARVRAARPVRGDRPRRRHRLLGEGPAEDHPQPDGGQADLLPVGAADLREDLHARHAAPPRTRSSSRQAVAGRASRSASCSSAARTCPAELQAGVRPGRGEAVQERPEHLRRATSASA